MGLISSFFKQKKPILTDEDNQKLKQIYREHYMKEAEILVKEQAKNKAKTDLGIKEKKEGIW